MPMKILNSALTIALVASGLGFAAATPAAAWSTGSTPTGGDSARQFADPDEAVDNIANGAQGGGGTELTVGGLDQGNASASVGGGITVEDTNAEPANPAWPLWMQWHQN
jgi:hypothetical protein